MKKKNEEANALTRREFLYLTGAGMAGIALDGLPSPAYGAEKKPKYGGRLQAR